MSPSSTPEKFSNANQATQMSNWEIRTQKWKWWQIYEKKNCDKAAFLINPVKMSTKLKKIFAIKSGVEQE